MKVYEVVQGDSDWFICCCGNEAHYDGFFSCDSTGRIVSPTLSADWDGSLYVCYRCGRIIEQRSLEVVGITDEDALLHNTNYDWGKY